MQAGTRAIVTGCDQPLGAATAERLRAAGATVMAMDVASNERSTGVAAVHGAAEQMGGLDVLVISGWHPRALQPASFEDIDDATFEATWEGGMQGMLWALQAAIPHLRASKGAAIVVLPTTGMTGGSHYATAATTFEGQRILMKAAARQLGPEAIRVNAIAVDSALVLADADAADVHYLAPDVAGEQSFGDVADIVTFLASPAGRHLHGQTLTIDGGRWLAP